MKSKMVYPDLITPRLLAAVPGYDPATAPDLGDTFTHETCIQYGLGRYVVAQIKAGDLTCVPPFAAAVEELMESLPYPHFSFLDQMLTSMFAHAKLGDVNLEPVKHLFGPKLLGRYEDYQYQSSLPFIPVPHSDY
jgi:hypothetical protein